MRCFDRQSNYTSAPDPGLQFIGGGPKKGDLGATGIIIPADPTPDESKRYLVRLAGITIPPDCIAIVRSIRQYITMGAECSLDNKNGQIFVFEKQIIFPTWRFVDGNIAWGLTINPPMETTASAPNLPVSSVGQPSPFIADTYGITPGILYRRLPTSVDPLSAGYVPPFNGIFLGAPIDSLGIFRDLRYTWYNYNDLDSNGYAVSGPGNICLWASIYQTDPKNRLFPRVPIEALPSISQEDQFVNGHQDTARYYRIAGEIIIDLTEKIVEQI